MIHVTFGVMFVIYVTNAFEARSNGTLFVKPQFGIIQQDHDATIEYPGVISGVRSCGGPSQVVQWRYGACVTGQEGLCKCPADGVSRRAELDFIPKENISGLGLRLNTLFNGTFTNTFEGPIPNSFVESKKGYTTVHTGGPRKELIGNVVTIQQMVYRLDNNEIEACVEGDFEIV